VSNPASGICNYFPCVADFWNGGGYLEVCNDGVYSLTGGRPGACSQHGGEKNGVGWSP
jgi:hypothetical protein